MARLFPVALLRDFSTPAVLAVAGVLLSPLIIMTGIHLFRVGVRRMQFGPARRGLERAWREQCLPALGSGRIGDLRNAILAADEIFLHALIARGFQGKTPSSRLAAAGRMHRELRKVERAQMWANRLRDRPSEEVDAKKLNEILKLYRTGLRDLGV